MQNFRNYYDILDVSQGATAAEIKSAYRKLARRYHPDLNPGDRAAEESFKTVGEAYEILSDADKRSQYDQFSRYWRQKGFPGGRRPKPRGVGSDLDFGQFQDFDNFVDQLLNRRSGATTINRRRTVRPATASDKVPPSPRQDPYEPRRTKKTYTVSQDRQSKPTEAQLTLPLEKAYRGGPERIRLETGQLLEVTLPSGLLDKQRIHLPQQGVDGGELYLRVFIEPHPLFRLVGYDLACAIPVTPSEAVLGGGVDVPTLDGVVKMTIPAGVYSGQRLRLAGKGYPAQGKRGDQIVELCITVPKDVSPRERELYEKLRHIEANPRLGLLQP
ncbi:MAG: J domain-containing protein [Elainellaceae cyanobacterium]